MYINLGSMINVGNYIIVEASIAHLKAINGEQMEMSGVYQEVEDRCIRMHSLRRN